MKANAVEPGRLDMGNKRLWGGIGGADANGAERMRSVDKFSVRKIWAAPPAVGQLSV